MSLHFSLYSFLSDFKSQKQIYISQWVDFLCNRGCHCTSRNNHVYSGGSSIMLWGCFCSAATGAGYEQFQIPISVGTNLRLSVRNLKILLISMDRRCPKKSGQILPHQDVPRCWAPKKDWVLITALWEPDFLLVCRGSNTYLIWLNANYLYPMFFSELFCWYSVSIWSNKGTIKI